MAWTKPFLLSEALLPRHRGINSEEAGKYGERLKPLGWARPDVLPSLVSAVLPSRVRLSSKSCFGCQGTRLVRRQRGQRLPWPSQAQPRWVGTLARAPRAGAFGPYSSSGALAAKPTNGKPQGSANMALPSRAKPYTASSPLASFASAIPDKRARQIALYRKPGPLEGRASGLVRPPTSSEPAKKRPVTASRTIRASIDSARYARSQLASCFGCPRMAARRAEC